MTFAVLCPGQGTQRAGIFDLTREHPAACEVLDQARAALGTDPLAGLADPASLFDNAIAQPLICVAQLAQWRALRDELPAPALFAGYSVGELSCYALADAIDAGTLAMLARRRAQAMDHAAAGRRSGLVALRGAKRPVVDGLCNEAGAYVAIAVADDVFVVGGTRDALEHAGASARGIGAQVTPLAVDVASHTPLMAAAVAAFRAALEDSPLGAPERPVVAGIDGTLVRSRARAIATLAEQIARTIEWGHCVETLYERGCRVFLELAPGCALSRRLRETYDDIEARAVEEFRHREGVVRWVARHAARQQGPNPG
jgi:[acyl-carrier-protein] S-malonyltransferase